MGRIVMNMVLPNARGIAHRKGGRPRDASLDGKIVAAALALVPEKGIDGTSMDDVAERAGVSKPTIYRRWPSKDDLMIEAISQLAQPIDGVAEPDVRVGTVKVIEDLTERISRYLDPVVPDPRLRAAFKDKVLSRERAQVGELIERAKAEGSIRGDIDVDTTIDFIYGMAFFYRGQIRIGEMGFDDVPERARQVVDQLFAGIAS